jgi:hypothetical protein
VVLAGCVHVRTAWVDPDGGVRVPACLAAVMIYSAEGGVGRPYQVLSLRDRAAELGTTGVILGGIYEPDVALTIAGELLGLSARREGSAAAIYGTRPARPIPPCRAPDDA